MSLFKGVKNALPNIIAKSSRGCRVWTTTGEEYLDMTMGIGVTNLGHCHPGVTKAAQAACDNLVHAQMNIMKHEPMMAVIDKLSATDLAKSSDFDSWFLWNSGTEAVEGAIKLARMATGKPNIINMNLGYHGRTFMAMALTTSGTVYRAGFQPLPAGVFPVPFPYTGRSPFKEPHLDSGTSLEDGFTLAEDGGRYNYWGGSSLEAAQKNVKRSLSEVELMLRTQTTPEETAAIILEPVLGEGGYVPPPPGYLSGLRELCDRYDILLIADEVQSGFGRTGSMFACDWIDGGVRPDVIIAAKGLANGYPLSAVGTRQELSNLQVPGSMGGTYGGNAVACAASVAVFNAFEKENVLDNSMQRARQARQALGTISSKHPGLIREVRGRGLMIGVEFNNTKGAPGTMATNITKKCWDKHLLVLACGPFDTLRLMPPLNISEEDLSSMLSIFAEAVDEVVS